MKKILIAVLCYMVLCGGTLALTVYGLIKWAEEVMMFY